MRAVFTQDIFQQVLDDAVDISLVQGSAHQGQLTFATKRCNDLKAKLKASRDNEGAAEEARQTAELQASKAQEELEALLLQLSDMDAEAVSDLDRQVAIRRSIAKLVREAVRVVEDLALRVEVKGRDTLGRTGSTGWAARLGSTSRASRAPAPPNRPSALDPKQGRASRAPEPPDRSLRVPPTWPSERATARPAAGRQVCEVRLARSASST
jgi:hypothetical protein